MIKNQLVKNCMTRKVVTAAPDTPLTNVIQMMVDHTIRRVPIVENERLVGIVTYGDVRDARPSSLKPPEAWTTDFFDGFVPVKMIMTRDPITVESQDTVGTVAGLMRNHMISGIPVVDSQKRVVGIITESDLFALIIQEWEEAPTAV